MSLVDASYGSDDDDDDVVEAQDGEEGKEEEKKKGVDRLTATIPTPVRSEDSLNATAIASSVVSPSASSMIERQSARGVVFPPSMRSPTDSAPRISLPDVSELFGTSAPNRTITSDASKKRPAANSSVNSLPRSKLPRGILHPARVAPDTAGGLLTPPQLRGRSNVATEDLDKIFSRRQKR